MKTKLISLILLSLFSLGVMADEIYLPTIAKPASLEEGTQTKLTDSQIAELLPWAKDSKMFLNDLLDSTQGLSMDDKIERLDFGIRQVVGDSAPKNSELLMRYVLNRALVLNDTLKKEMSADAVGTADTKLRVLISSIKMSIKYYESDMSTLTKKSTPDFYTFGMEYFNFLTELNKSIFDASAQYNVQKTSLEWLQWDLYRDLNNATYAPIIVKINNALKLLPSSKQTDLQCIKNIQQLKKISQQVNLNITAKTEIISQTITTPTIVIKGSDADRYGYSTYYAKCFPKSASGDLMTSSQVDDAYCARENAYSYSTYYAKCYKVSHSGDAMTSSRVDDAKCAVKGKFHYSTYYAKCFMVSNSGDDITTTQVNDSKCQRENSYNYSTYYAKCFMVSNSGDDMTTSRVPDNMCARPDAFHYSSYYGKCFMVSNKGDDITSTTMDPSYCQKR